ncbi:unnamed protein product [Euphydryas editha]|uniref:Endonuclease/exonuclease/phosphatase domain-containing protein n=1 Tax=Euphydryas editha TaxID=104508 RepID=A0AAU9V218_EUPED|nr:unnamed protein product [Euphydryas editha]
MGNTSSVQLENFSNNLSDIINSCPNDEFIIMGDFNLPHIDWDPEGNYFALSGISLSGAQINFVDTLAQCDLIQRSQANFLEYSPNSNFTYPMTQKINNYNIGDIHIDNDELLKLLESVNLNKDDHWMKAMYQTYGNRRL